MTAYNDAFIALYSGYYQAWRFSGARSVQAATSDRARLGGPLNDRCPLTVR
ncbi:MULTISPECIES: hypothetical protein [unclassified Halomonas]|uniref:hypothetical protein n=1 Tax=unclassified Halomonas TaxID=2609666 RepID=UPI002076B40D|nr:MULTISPECIES: hypothetical protein [unclassified Halomonas]